MLTSRGWCRYRPKPSIRAIELNGAAVEFNRRAFRWGRRAAVDRALVAARATPASAKPPGHRLSETLDEIIARRVEFLTGYQNAAYAARYAAGSQRIRAAEAAAVPGSSALAEAAARALFKLMAYKDEYEVARLYTGGDFLEQIARQVRGRRTSCISTWRRRWWPSATQRPGICRSAHSARGC